MEVDGMAPWTTIFRTPNRWRPPFPGLLFQGVYRMLYRPLANQQTVVLLGLIGWAGFQSSLPHWSSQTPAPFAPFNAFVALFATRLAGSMKCASDFFVLSCVVLNLLH